MNTCNNYNWQRLNNNKITM